MSKINSAVKCVNYHLKKKNNIMILSDNEKDAKSIYYKLYDYAEYESINVKVISSLPDDFYKSLNYNLIFIIGFGGDNFYLHEELTKHGIDVIIFDEGVSEFAIILNCDNAVENFCTVFDKTKEEL